MDITRGHLRVILTIGGLMIPLIAEAADVLSPVPLSAITADLYSYALSIVGLAVFIMFILAGLARMIPAFQKMIGAEPSAIIKDAVIGLIILVAAFVILNTINPQLVTTGTP